MTTRDGRPVYVKDVATVVIGPSPQEHRVWNDARDGKGTLAARTRRSAWRSPSAPGANAVVVSRGDCAPARRAEGRG